MKKSGVRVSIIQWGNWLSLLSIAVLSGTSGSAQAELPYCQKLRGEKEAYCLALKTIEYSGECDDLSFNRQAQILCQTLDLLNSHGSCFYLADPSDPLSELRSSACTQIRMGVFNEEANPSLPRWQENWYRFGKYIADEHPFLARRFQAKYFRKGGLSERLILWKKDLPSEGFQAISTYLPQVVNLGSHLFPDFEREKTERLGPFLSQLIPWVEKNREILHSKAAEGQRYFPLGTSFDEASSSSPCALIVDEKGRIVVLLKSARIGDEKVFTEIVEGSFKKYSYAVDYDKGISTDPTLEGHALLAVGRVKQRFRPELTGKNYEKILHEFKMHQQFSQAPGFADAGLMITSSSRKYPYKRLTFLQNLYDTDLFEFLEKLRIRSEGQPAHILGRSFNRFVLDINVQVLQALTDLHSSNVIHRDIKPENILLKFNDQGKITVHITDFGHADFWDALSGLSAEQVFGIGTPRYWSPEKVRRERRSPESSIYDEIWATGLALYYFANWWTPTLDNDSDFEFIQHLAKVHSYSDLALLGLKDLTQEPEVGTVNHVLYQMLNPRPEERISVAEALREMKEVQARVEAIYDPEFYFEPYKN